MNILLTVAVTPMLLVALYGLVFDFADALIYSPAVFIALGILALACYPLRRRNTGKTTSI